MCSKRVEKEINDLHDFVSKFGRNEHGGDGFKKTTKLFEERKSTATSSVQIDPLNPPLASNSSRNEHAGDKYFEKSKWHSEKSSPDRSFGETPQLSTLVPAPPETVSPLNTIFSFKGTANRSEYFFYHVVALVVVGMVGAIVASDDIGEGWVLLSLCLVAWVLLATTVKRWRHTGYNMWWLVTLLIPYVNLIMMLILLFAPPKKRP